MKIQRMLFVASLISAFVLSSCSSDEDPAPTPIVVANAGPDKKIPTGQTVTLDGSASKDNQGLALSYLWTVVKKPVNSAPLLSDATIVNPVFSPDLEGVYELELTVANDHGSQKDNVVITVEYQPSVLTHITTPTVLEDRIANPQIADYWVNEDITVDAALTVKPGVVIAFAEDTHMQVGDNGSLSAKGEAERKITFTGKSNEEGYWRGIIFYSGSNANELLHAEVLNAGRTILVSGIRANITVAEDARLSIKNTKVAGSGGYGIFFMESSVITGFSSNTISNNNEAPLLVFADHVAKLDAASSLSVGNNHNVVEVMPSFITGTNEVTWPAFTDGTPYRFLGTVATQTGLKLSPGITIEMVANEYFEVAEGYLYAKGTAEKKIRFTGVDKTASSWKGIIVYTRSNFNLLENVEINYAGNDEIISGVPAGLVITGGGSLVMKNSSISHSGGYGIFVNGNDVTLNPDVVALNTFVSNESEPVHYQD